MMKRCTNSSTPERRFRAAEGAQEGTDPARTRPCAPSSDAGLFAWFFALPLVAICALGAALIWWLL